MKFIETDRDVEIVSNGLQLLSKTINRVYIDENAVKTALSLYILGHKDLIDN